MRTSIFKPSRVHWILILGISLASSAACVKSPLLLLSRFSRVRLCATPWTAAHQASFPWDSPGKNTGVGCHFLLQCMKVKSESEVAQSCLTLATPWTAAHQAPPSMGFSRQKYWREINQKWPMLSEVAQSCPTLCDPVDCSLLGSSLHGTLQARILEWVAISFSKGASQPRDRSQVSHIAVRFFTI